MSANRMSIKLAMGLLAVLLLVLGYVGSKWFEYQEVRHQSVVANAAMEARVGQPEILMRDVFTSVSGTICAVTNSRIHEYELAKYAGFVDRADMAERASDRAAPYQYEWTLVWSQKDGTASAGRILSARMAIRNALEHNNKQLNNETVAKDCAPLKTAKLVKVNEWQPVAYILVDEADYDAILKSSKVKPLEPLALEDTTGALTPDNLKREYPAVGAYVGAPATDEAILGGHPAASAHP